MAHLERKMVPLYLTDQEKEQLDLYAEILVISCGSSWKGKSSLASKI